MDHVGDVDVGDRPGQAGDQPGQRAAAQRAVVGDRRVQRRTGNVLGDHPGQPRVGVGVDDLGDVAAVHPAHGLDLTGQPGAGDVVAGHLRAQHLDRDEPILRIYGLVHNAHSALTDTPADRVWANAFRQPLVLGETCRHCHSELIPSNPAYHRLPAYRPGRDRAARRRAARRRCSGRASWTTATHPSGPSPDRSAATPPRRRDERHTGQAARWPRGRAAPRLRRRFG